MVMRAPASGPLPPIVCAIPNTTQGGSDSARTTAETRRHVDFDVAAETLVPHRVRVQHPNGNLANGDDGACG